MSNYKSWHPSSQELWQGECMHWHGEILVGEFSHYCYDWDELPIDETCDEFECCTCEFIDWDLKAKAMHVEALSRELNESENATPTEGPLGSS